MGGPEVERLITLLSRLPGFGPRSARRAALRLLQNPEARMVPLAAALSEAAAAVRQCTLCGNLDSRDPCAICTDPQRDRGMICVVEGVGDLWALERAGVHGGLYHVLGGTLSALAGTGPDDLNLPPLLERVGEGGVREVILALGATVDGATTAHWLTERLAPLGVAISRVAQGMPNGGALDALDDGDAGGGAAGAKAGVIRRLSRRGKAPSAEDGGGYLIAFPDRPEYMSDGETVADTTAHGMDARRGWIAAVWTSPRIAEAGCTRTRFGYGAAILAEAMSRH